MKNCHLVDNTYYKYVSDDFQFEYGAINVKPRFHIDRKIKEEFIQFKAAVAKINSQFTTIPESEKYMIEWERCE